MKRSTAFDPEADSEFDFDVSYEPRQSGVAVRWGGREVLTREKPGFKHVNYPFAFIKYVVRGTGLAKRNAVGNHELLPCSASCSVPSGFMVMRRREK